MEGLGTSRVEAGGKETNVSTVGDPPAAAGRVERTVTGVTDGALGAAGVETSVSIAGELPAGPLMVDRKVIGLATSGVETIVSTEPDDAAGAE